MKVTVIPIVVGALGTGLEKKTERIGNQKNRDRPDSSTIEIGKVGIRVAILFSFVW